MRDMPTADAIAAVVERRIRRSVISAIGTVPKLAAGLVVVLQLVILVRGGHS